MAKKSAAASPALTGDVVLHYLGGADGRPFLTGVPARALTDGDVARLAWREGGREGMPADTTPEARAAVVDRLLASELYSTTPPAPEPAPAEG